MKIKVQKFSLSHGYFAFYVVNTSIGWSCNNINDVISHTRECGKIPISEVSTKTT